MIRPFLPPNINTVLYQNLDGQPNPIIFFEEFDNHALTNKWCNILNIDMSTDDWTNISKICYKTFQANDRVWFQYRRIHRILGASKYFLFL